MDVQRVAIFHHIQTILDHDMFCQNKMGTVHFMDIESLDLLSTTEVAELLNVSKRRVHSLAEQYRIPHKILSCGKIFLREDIEVMQEKRKGKMKHARKK